MSQYLKDEEFLKELREIEEIARNTERPKKMMVSEEEYEDLKNSGSDMERFYRRKDVQHISKIIPTVMERLEKNELIPF